MDYPAVLRSNEIVYYTTLFNEHLVYTTPGSVN